jgi:hypothetical protein
MFSIERRTYIKFTTLLLLFTVSVQLLGFLEKMGSSLNNIHPYVTTTEKDEELKCNNFCSKNNRHDIIAPTAHAKLSRRKPILTHKMNSTKVLQTVWTECLRINITPIQDVNILLQHSENILKASEVFRDLPALSYKGFSGPTLEQHWIRTFGKLPLRDFLPWVPLFIQWTDYGARGGYIKRSKRYNRLEKWMLEFLRKDIIYITVVQYDQGIGNLQLLFPNIVTISSGGYGYAKIPLLLRPLSPLPPPSRDSTLLSFTGSLKTHVMRRKAHNMLRKLFGSSYRVYEGEDWMTVVNSSRFIVCPRGFARSAFKLYETIDLRRVPIYIYDDIPWLPYERKIDWKKLAILVQFSKLHELPKRLRRIDEVEYANMINFAEELHDTHFTAAGVMEKVDEFMRQPWSSSISCNDLPQNTG